MKIKHLDIIKTLLYWNIFQTMILILATFSTFKVNWVTWSMQVKLDDVKADFFVPPNSFNVSE